MRDPAETTPEEDDALAIRAEIRALRAALQAATESWRCFHCNAVFESRALAEQHFGYTGSAAPLCFAKLSQQLNQARAEAADMDALRGAAEAALQAATERAERAERGWDGALAEQDAAIARARELVDEADQRADAAEAQVREMRGMLEAVRSGLVARRDGFNRFPRRGCCAEENDVAIKGIDAALSPGGGK